MTAPREPIFDSRPRTNALPADHAESTFAFLNRVAGDFWEHPRRLVQAWADHATDPTDYNELRGRFRSGDDYQFRSAFLELYLHECLTAAGYAITIHPEVPGTTRRPDFLATREDTAVYLEAIAPGSSDSSRRAAARRDVLFDTVNRVGDGNFTLWLDDLKEGTRPPSAAKLRAELRRWLAPLNPDDYPNLEGVPTFRWERDGWVATFRAIPKATHARGPSRPGDRAIGVYAHSPAAFVDDAPTVRDALADKHHAYGDLAAPFIIVVGLYIHDSDRHQRANALYGDEAVQWRETANGEVVTRMVRQPNGYFGAPPNWQHRHVSGVLLVNQLQPYFVLTADTALWRHPDPMYPMPADLGLPGDTVALAGNQLDTTRSSVSPAELFGLPVPWPPGEPWPHE